jgi:peptidoglycan/LPS O-acetylase OafA/YrhL
MANWHFAIQDTDYFHATEAVSPIQHFWSLSIEEQFYFAWPALIFLISAVVIRKAWTHGRRMMLAGAVMGVVIAASLGWALYQTATSAAWAYFDTFARIWELGVGALLATAVGTLARIPRAVKPVVSWVGILLIGASLFLIAENSVGFPAPWALLPVVGAALVIVAGVDGEPRYQAFLRNPVSGYVGDISYSLYLVHWPVIVILGSLMDTGAYFSITVVALAFGLSIASYHFVESPLRRADWSKLRRTVHEIRRHRYRYQPERSKAYAALGALTLLVVALFAYIERPEPYQHTAPPPLAETGPDALNPTGPAPTTGPLTAALQSEIVEALKVTEWPVLDPTMEAVINDPAVKLPPIPGCGGITFVNGVDRCTWGAASAPIKVVILGNSVALYYVEPLRDIAENSGGQIQIHTEAMPGCNFVNDLISNEDPEYVAACPGRKQHALDYINSTKPDIVILSHNYATKQVQGTNDELTPKEWTNSLGRFVEKFRANTRKIVLLAPPPGDVAIADCYGRRSNTPPDCIGHVDNEWLSMARAERDFAASTGGTWVDSRPWFCRGGRLCPSFVAATPTKLDAAHLVPAYGRRIFPVIGESFKEAGVF